jgi:L-fuconolactonase
MTKRFEGRDEAIIDPDLAIIDSHHHLLDRPNLRYLLDDFRADADTGHRIVASVYIETQAMTRASGPEHLRPLGEVEFANGIGAMAASGLYGACQVCAGIVGHAAISRGDVVAELLDMQMAAAPDRFRGVRQMALTHPGEALGRILPVRFPDGIIASGAFRDGFHHVAARRLSFDATVFHTQLPEVAALADDFPDTTIVLNHLGMAMGLGLDEAGRKELFDEWRDRLVELARRPNVLCKIGGLGMIFWGFGFEQRVDPIGYRELAGTWRPYIEAGIEAFGVERCMMESNFPLEGVSCGYVPLWNALKHVVGAYTADEKAALFHGVAARAYRIDTGSIEGIL